MHLTELNNREQAEFLRLCLDSTIEGFYAVDTEGHTTFCNSAFLTMLGFKSVDEVTGKKLHNLIHHSHPDGTPYDVADCPIYQAASTGKQAHVPFELFFRLDKSSFPVEYRAVPLHKDGVLVGAICTFIDISNRIAQEAAMTSLRAVAGDAAARLQLALDSGAVLGTWLWELKSDRLRLDERYVRTFNMPASAVEAGATIEECIAAVHPEDADLVRGRLQQARERGGVYKSEHRIRGPAGKGWRWIESNGRFDLAAQIFSGVIIDTDARKQAEAKMTDASDRLRANEHYLNHMLASVRDHAIISLDEAGTILLWNRGAEEIFGYQPDEIIGQNIEIIFTPEDRQSGGPAYEMMQAAATGSGSDERWHVKKSGARFYSSGTVSPFIDGSGEIKGYIKIARDMTDQRNAQEALLEARNAAEAANMAKTEFLTNMSHEIRTPMNAIMGLSNILGISKPLTDKQREFIRTLQQSADSLLALINDLLDIAKIEARTVELERIPFSLARIIEEVASMMAMQVKKKGLTFEGHGKSVENRMFMGDPTRLRQIIVNLCSNAIKFTEVGGVSVSITCEELGDPQRELIHITVQDTGIGIPQDKLGLVFQKFMQADTSINRKYGGTGLGLAITKTIVELMGGAISVASEVGKGSLFHVALPLEIADHLEIASADGSLIGIQASMVERKIADTILLVEDYAPNVMVATVFLEQFGYTVEVAGNGLEAFEMVQRKHYLVVLMDVQMHGMNGLEATQLIREHEIKENLPRLPIIGMTAHALSGDRERCLSAGMDEYIPKPFNPDELHTKIRDITLGARHRAIGSA